MASHSACPAPWSCAPLLATQLLWINLITDSGPALAIGVDPPTDDEAGLRMTAEWHKPVSAFLDYFQVGRITLIGMPLGGCLVMRAAALEPRIERVVAFDIFKNGLDISLRQAPRESLVVAINALMLKRTHLLASTSQASPTNKQRPRAAKTVVKQVRSSVHHKT